MSVRDKSNEDRTHQLVHAYQQMIDPSRQVFAQAVRNTIRALAESDDAPVVVDVGTGSGWLALEAASAGAAKVYAIEDLDLLCEQARQAFAGGPAALELVQVKVLNKWEPPAGQQIDVLVCDLISTGLLLQPQVFLVNAYRRYLKQSGSAIIPASASTYISLARASFAFDTYEDYNDFSFLCPFEEGRGLPRTTSLSGRALLIHTDFMHHIPLSMRRKAHLTADTTGAVNAVKLETVVHVAEDLVATESASVCHPIVYPISPGLHVSRGDQILVDVFYRYPKEPQFIPDSADKIEITVQNCQTGQEAHISGQTDTTPTP